MKILIFGGGYVAQHFLNYFGGKAQLSPIRIQDYSAVLEELKLEKPDVVLNCAGKTGKPNVDWCESHKEETLFGNVTVPLILARACAELGLYMVHVGSGCVYTGDKDGQGFTEDDAPNFTGSFYSKTKAWSESMFKEFPILQLRLRMPLDGVPGPRNFMTKITHYSKVISVPNSISVMKDFVCVAEALIERRATGIYNMTNPGAVTHVQLLDWYKELVDPNFHYEVFSLEELAKVTQAGRSNCVLSSTKLAEEGLAMRPVEEAVREALLEYRSNMV